MSTPSSGSAPGRGAQTPAPFNPRQLTRSVITVPLQEELDSGPEDMKHSVVIDVNVNYVGGREGAWTRLQELLAHTMRGVRDVSAAKGPQPRDGRWMRRHFDQYIVVSGITAKELKELVRLDTQGPSPEQAVDAQAVAAESTPGAAPEPRAKRRTRTAKSAAPGAAGGEAGAGAGAPRTSRHAIYRIWPNFRLTARTTKSVATVKADAAHNAFSALGEGIVWAVIDSGIEGGHPHFRLHRNLEPVLQLHRSFVDDKPLEDEYGHGTHVAGIIAGAATPPKDPQNPTAFAVTLLQPEPGAEEDHAIVPVTQIAGMAPRTQLVSLKVLRDDGTGDFSDALAAIEYVQEVNANGRNITIHGVNISAGYAFDPRWFGCGQSPLCVEVDRLVRSGVVVVAAAGNFGYGAVDLGNGKAASAGLSVTIADPGNAEMAITVGSTHRDKPHTYGVSYFSSKGPTGDGRLKPDLVAPGERILSCAAQSTKKRLESVVPAGTVYDYVEDSGTSMAAPHVSGVVAAFLSIRNEFIGHPERVKEIFVGSATDLGRERYFQGAGLVDLMRAIQSA